MPEKNEKTAEVRAGSQSGGWKGNRTMEERICGKMSFEPGLEERRSNGW